MINRTGADSPCDCGSLERPRYFPRQLVTPDDMNLEQEYFRKRMRLHNLMLHGWGVVCGAEVCRVKKPQEQWSNPKQEEHEEWKVRIKRGYVLGPYGHDILIDCDHEFDIRSRRLTGTAGEPAEAAVDPWCSQPAVDLDQDEVFIAVKYTENLTRPVRTQPVGCGCDETQCEYSRWRDCYEFGILDECPEDQMTFKSPEEMFAGPGVPQCPCPETPWVVLARIKLNENGIDGDPDNCACRRLVAAFGNLAWSCGSESESEVTAPPPPPPEEPAIRGESIFDSEEFAKFKRLKGIHRLNVGVNEIEGLGGESAIKLNDLFSKGEDDELLVSEFLFVARNPDGRAWMTEDSGITEKLIMTWACRADLMRISGNLDLDIDRQMAEVLSKTEVDGQHFSVARLANYPKDDASIAELKRAISIANNDRIPDRFSNKEKLKNLIDAANEHKSAVFELAPV